MQLRELLSLCRQGTWPALDAKLTQALRDHPDNADICAMAAHVALRRGNRQITKFFVHKAQGLKPDHHAARVEDICLDFYESRFELSRQKLHATPIADVDKEHPIHAIAAYLEALFGAEYPPAEADVMGAVQQYLQRGDKLLALLAARIGELNHPTVADSFAALGLANIYAGFYKNADGNFHEAVFRQTQYMDVVNIHHFYLFCRQARYGDALTIGFNIEKQHKLDAHGQGLLLEMMLRSGTPLEEVEKRLALLEPHLQARKEMSPVVEMVKLRVALLRGAISAEKAIQLLAPQVARADCPAAFLYCYAQLNSRTNIPAAKQAASRALAMDHLHPDAAHWDDAEQNNALNFEFAGLFIPREHEGSAWPTPTQMELLHLLFQIPPEDRVAAWQSFAAHHSLYTLEAGAYRLLPYVYKQLEHHEFAEKELLKGIWKKSYIENALKIKFLLAAHDMLAREGIEMVLLKGLANAVPLYGDLGSRPMSDADVLIPLEKLEQAHALFLRHGWCTDEVPTSDRARFAYAMTYRHPEGGMLDVHWRPCEIFSNDHFTPDDFGAFENVELMGKALKTFAPTLNLFCTIYHGVEWNHLSPVRWVADALLILRKHSINWSEINRLALKYQALPVIAAGLKFLTRFEDLSQLPQSLQQAMEKDDSDHHVMRIRLRPRNIIATADEARAMLEHFRSRFSLTDRDHFFICGGNNPEDFQAMCKEQNVHWLPVADRDAMLRIVKGQEINFNMLVIDANLSCTFNCLNVRVENTGS